MPSLVQRSKLKFRSARSAWQAIERSTGIKPKTHKLEKDHTKKLWRWRVRGKK